MVPVFVLLVQSCWGRGVVAAPDADVDRGPWRGADCVFKNVFIFINQKIIILVFW